MRVEFQPNPKTSYDKVLVTRTGQTYPHVKARDLPIKVGLELDDANDPGVFILPVDTSIPEGKTLYSYHVYVTDSHLNVNGHRVTSPTYKYEDIIITKVEDPRT